MLGVTHWSSRLAIGLKVDHATVAWAWKAYGVAPWRCEKSQIQPLERTVPMLALQPGLPPPDAPTTTGSTQPSVVAGL